MLILGHGKCTLNVVNNISWAQAIVIYWCNYSMDDGVENDWCFKLYLLRKLKICSSVKEWGSWNENEMYIATSFIYMHNYYYYISCIIRRNQLQLSANNYNNINVFSAS